MRHLMSPLDLSKEELDDLLTLASDIETSLIDVENLLLFSVTEIFSLAQSYTSGIDFSRRFHKYFFENQSGSKPQWRIVQTDDTMTLQWYTAVIPGTHSELLQEASTDLLTIRSLKGRLDNLTIGLCGDLKFGRTVHSLIEALVLRYSNVKFVLISPEELRVPSYIREDILEKNNVEFEEVERLEDALPKLDILYMTRVQISA